MNNLHLLKNNLSQLLILTGTYISLTEQISEKYKAFVKQYGEPDINTIQLQEDYIKQIVELHNLFDYVASIEKKIEQILEEETAND